MTNHQGQHSQLDLVGSRIMLVEDDYLLAMDLCEELVGLGAEVIGPTADLDESISWARSEPDIDAVVVDINLHGERSFPLIDELIKRDINVVLSTGYDEQDLPYRLRHLPRYLKPSPAREIALGVARLVTAP